MEMRLKSTASRSDNDITDEAAGRARVEMAMQSMQRRQAHKEALARSNSDMRQRLSRSSYFGRPNHSTKLIDENHVLR